MNRWCAVTKNNDARIEIASQMFPGQGERPAEAKCFNNLALFLNISEMSFMRTQSREISPLQPIVSHHFPFPFDDAWRFEI